ncbi:hypothetical protein [Paenibacillus radicis (ex Gao et al. 2016)]|uniref:Uncharacterized protein n=1 Tax=Paenibacillus radicis (ex Gao et al. 2016) TaxID=1737354 RepID=A0A917HL25_9BACL|nr:hypothetical protein [Paenibacillus radicis (ex Gao et al. 2016)]GGG82625.1 hypothetical protein GCM10010918_45080 [Paenibacillus radicis (ex Gao et al. 2016)]
MSSFFDKVKASVAEAGDKVKAGVVEAGNKAKTVMEINKLKLQNNSKLNEIERQYREIGKQVFEAKQLDSAAALSSDDLEPFMNTIKGLQEEIEHNLKEIKFLSDDNVIVEQAKNDKPVVLMQYEPEEKEEK